MIPPSTLPPPPNLTIQKSKFEKMKKASKDAIILTFCNEKHDKMMYAYSDMECNRQFFVILGNFCSFTPLLTPKTKIWKKCKKHVEILPFLHICTINQDHMLYRSWDIDNKRLSFLSLWVILCHLTLLTTKKMKIWKNKKLCLEKISF